MGLFWTLFLKLPALEVHRYRWQSLGLLLKGEMIINLTYSWVLNRRVQMSVIFSEKKAGCQILLREQPFSNFLWVFKFLKSINTIKIYVLILLKIKWFYLNNDNAQQYHQSIFYITPIRYFYLRPADVYVFSLFFTIFPKSDLDEIAIVDASWKK